MIFYITFSKSVLLFVLVFMPYSTQWAVEDEGCRTPDLGVGNCIPLQDCKIMLDALREADPLSLEAKTKYWYFQCGVQFGKIKVCCPETKIFLGEPDAALNTRGAPPPPDVSGHQNLYLLPKECGLQISRDKIANGNKTELLEFPWMALLSYETGNTIDFECGGTIINERYILTAAHCLTNLGSRSIIGVRLGEHNISSIKDCQEESEYSDSYCAPPFQDIAIDKVIPHPLYNWTTFSNDIGLIRLASRINISVDNAKPICLPVAKEMQNKDFTSSSLIVSGWGKTETGASSDDLLKAIIPVTSEEECRKGFRKTNAVINYKQICTLSKDHLDSCEGDSGGPLQLSYFYNDDLRYLQFGVVSFGDSVCGRNNYPGVYTRIEYYLNWILDNIKP